MTTKDIVKKYLEDNKFDGLFNDNFPCACELSDLMPCCEDFSDCEPGYKTKCTDDNCALDGDCKFHISPVIDENNPKFVVEAV